MLKSQNPFLEHFFMILGLEEPVTRLNLSFSGEGASPLESSGGGTVAPLAPPPAYVTVPGWSLENEDLPENI